MFFLCNAFGVNKTGCETSLTLHQQLAINFSCKMLARVITKSKLLSAPRSFSRKFSQVELTGLTPDQIAKISNVDKEIRHRHESINVELSEKDFDEVRRKRMIYRSKQRGWLEADLLMGSWAMENVPTLNNKELDEYDLLLKEETIDIYNFVSGKDPLPDHLKDLGVMKRMQEYAINSKVIDPESYEKLKRHANLT